MYFAKPGGGGDLALPGFGLYSSSSRGSVHAKVDGRGGRGNWDVVLSHLLGKQVADLGSGADEDGLV
eukprot:3884392-Pyramimonas_sp.AAC.1